MIGVNCVANSGFTRLACLTIASVATMPPGGASLRMRAAMWTLGPTSDTVWRKRVPMIPITTGPMSRCPPGCDIPTKARLRLDAIEGWLASQQSIEALVAGLDRARLACARVEGLREALTGELARERELLVHVDDRRGGTRPVVRMPYRFSKSSAQVKGPAARRGEHNAHVLTRVLGYDAARIRELVEAGILSAAEPDER